MLGLHVPVPMVYGHDNLLVHNVISSFSGNCPQMAAWLPAPSPVYCFIRRVSVKANSAM